MKVSIITVSYNSADTIRDTIESVLSQTYAPIEYIVVDGASTDGTRAVIDAYRDAISTVISEADAGPYEAMNKGIDRATGDLIGLLHSDDVYTGPDVIHKVVHHMTEPNTDGLYGDLIFVDSRPPGKVIRYWKAGAYRQGSFKVGWMPPHPTFFVKKRIYEQYGSFNIALKNSADYELMLRFIHKHQIKLSYIAEVLVRHRVGGLSNASLRNRLRANKEDRLAWTMNAMRPAPFFFIRKPLSKIKQWLAVIGAERHETPLPYQR